MRRLLVFAVLVYSVILFRAYHQAITIDEADSYNNFVAPAENHFTPSSANHVLHSILAHYITRALGLSQFTVRLTSMLGAAIYLLAAISIALRIAPQRRLLAFAILTLNPFVLDYLIAARGYSLALGFLAAIVALAMTILDVPPRELRVALLTGAQMSVCAALALIANFSFAFALACTVGSFLLIGFFRFAWKHWLALAAATTLPGVAIAYAVVGDTLRNYPRKELYFGAESWPQMWMEMLDAVFPDRNLSFPLLHATDRLLAAARHASPYLILILLAIGLWSVFANKSWSMRFLWLALAGTLAAHGLAHSFQGLLLPMDRTSLFIVFFLTIGATYGAAAAPYRLARTAATTVLCATLAVFVLSFRTNYFRIWDFDMDTNRGFQALAEYAKDHPVKSAGCTWHYTGAYNFYRAARHANLPECEFIDPANPPPRDAYVVNNPSPEEFLAKTNIRIIYRGAVSGLVVGIAPPAWQTK